MKDPESFGALVDGLPAVAFHCTPEGEARALSSYWTQLTGQPILEGLGRGWARHFDNQKLVAAVTKTAAKLRPGEAVQYVVRCSGQYGEWFWLRAAIQPQWQDGRLTGLSGLAMVVPPEPSLTEGVATEPDQVTGWAEALLMASPDALYELTP